MSASIKQLGTITILVDDRHKYSQGLNKLLTDAGELILARMGVNLVKECLSDCSALITVAVEGSAEKIIKLTEAINDEEGMKARSVIMNV